MKKIGVGEVIHKWDGALVSIEVFMGEHGEFIVEVSEHSGAVIQSNMYPTKHAAVEYAYKLMEEYRHSSDIKH